jgi:transcriptional regulator with XRE-family HTH domain
VAALPDISTYYTRQISRVKDDVQITWQTTGEAVTLMAVAGRQALVGARLVALREDLGISQEEAVALTQGAITLRQWQRWESGESEPYKRNLAKLSEVFDIPIGEFFGEAGGPTSQLDRIEQMLADLLSRLPAYDDELERADLEADLEERARQSEERVSQSERTSADSATGKPGQQRPGRQPRRPA